MLGWEHYRNGYLIRPLKRSALFYWLPLSPFVCGTSAIVSPVPDRVRAHPLYGDFLGLILAYASWLSSEVGSGRVEGKIPLNMATEARIQKGMSVEEAAFGVAPDLTLSGIYIRPYIDTFRSFHPTATEWLHLLAIKAKAVEKAAVENLGDPRTGAPALFATAILGLFVRPWSLRVALDQLHLTMVLSLAIVGTFFIYNANPRFYLLFVPVFCIWGAAGIYQLSQWAQRSAKLSALHPSRRAFSGAAAAALAIASIYFHLRLLRWLGLFRCAGTGRSRKRAKGSVRNILRQGWPTPLRSSLIMRGLGSYGCLTVTKTQH